jgi:hypothetical protein
MWNPDELITTENEHNTVWTPRFPVNAPKDTPEIVHRLSFLLPPMKDECDKEDFEKTYHENINAMGEAILICYPTYKHFRFIYVELAKCHVRPPCGRFRWKESGPPTGLMTIVFGIVS